MVSIDEYKANPCRVSSIPYWKMINVKTPDKIKIINDVDYVANKNNQGADTLYFRLKHNLQGVEPINLDKMFQFRNVDTNSDIDLKKVVDIINKCYTDIQVNLAKVIQWTIRLSRRNFIEGAVFRETIFGM